MTTRMDLASIAVSKKQTAASAYVLLLTRHQQATEIAAKLNQNGSGRAGQLFLDEANKLRANATQLVQDHPGLGIGSAVPMQETVVDYSLPTLATTVNEMRRAYAQLVDAAQVDMPPLSSTALADGGAIRKKPTTRIQPVDILLLLAILLVVIALMGRYIVAPQIVRNYYDNGVASIASGAYDDAITSMRYVITNDVLNQFPDKNDQLDKAYQGSTKALLDAKNWDTARVRIAEWRTLPAKDPQQPVESLLQSYYLPAVDANSSGQWAEARRLLDQLDSIRIQEGYPDGIRNYQKATLIYNDSLAKEAAVAINEQRWADAQPLLDQLRQRDPASAEAKRLLLTSYYYQARAALDAQNWQGARDFVFAATQTYSDADTLQFKPANVNPDWTMSDLRSETYYQPGVAALDAKDYPTARGLFSSLITFNRDNPYKDTSTKFLDTYYLPAADAFNQGDYATARTAFADLFSVTTNTAYLDAHNATTLRSEAYYRPAVQLLTAKDYKGARALFDDLLKLAGNYHNDTITQRLETFYQEALDAFNAKDWTQAQTLFQAEDLLDFVQANSVRGYKDSAIRLREAYLEPARTLAQTGQWDALKTLLTPYWNTVDKFNLRPVGSDPADREILVLWRDAHYEAAFSALLAGDYDGAIALYTSDVLVDLESYDALQDNLPASLVASRLPAAEQQLRGKKRMPRFWLEAAYYWPAQQSFIKGEYAQARTRLDTMIRYYQGQRQAVPQRAELLRLQTFYQPALNAFNAKDWAAARTQFANQELLRNFSIAALRTIALDSANKLVQSYLVPAQTHLDAAEYDAARNDVLALLAVKQAWEIDIQQLPIYRQAATIMRQSYFLPAQATVEKIEAYSVDRQQAELTSILTDLTGARAQLETLIALDPPPAQPFAGSFDLLRATYYLEADALVNAGQLDKARTALLQLIALDGRAPTTQIFRREATTALLTRAFYSSALGFSGGGSPDWDTVISILEPLSTASAQYPQPGYLDEQTETLLVDAYYQKASILSEQAKQANDAGKVQEMLKLLDKLLALRPAHAGAATLLLDATYTQAKVDFNNQNYKDARERLQALVTDRGQLSSLLADLLEKDPYYRDAATLLREAYYVPAKQAFDRGDWTTARAELDALFKVIPPESDYKDARSMQYESYYQEALALRTKNDLSGATDALAQLLALTSAYKDAATLRNEIQFQLANDQYDQGQYTAARASLDVLLTNEPLYPGALKLKRDTYVIPAKAAIDKKDWDTARRSLSELLATDSGYAEGEYLLRDTYYQEAKAYYDAQKWDDAQRVLRGVKDRSPNYADVNVQALRAQITTLYYLSFYTPGLNAFNQQQWREARKYLVPLVEVDDGGRTFKPAATDKSAFDLLMESYVTESVIAVSNKNYAVAEQVLTEALRRKPDDPAIKAQLVNAVRLPAEEAFTAEDWGTARQKYQQILKLDDSLDWAWQGLIDTYLKPADQALNVEQNWGVARVLYSNVLDLFAAQGQGAIPQALLETPPFQDMAARAETGYFEAYYLPGSTALQAQDWLTARFQFLLPLYNDLKLRDKPYKDTVDLLIQTYTTPITAAIDKGNTEVAQALIAELLGFTENELATENLFNETMLQAHFRAEQLEVERFRKPLQTAIENADWETAVGLFERLREERNVDNAVLDAFITEFPDLRARMVQQSSPRWIEATPAPPTQPVRHNSSLTALAVSSGGTRIVTGDINGLVKVTGQYGALGNDLIIQTNTTLISSITIDPKGRWFVTTSDDQRANVWSLSNGQQLRVLNTHTAYISAVAVDPTGAMVATGSHDNSVLLWSPSADWSELPDPIKLDQPSRVTALAFSLDGKLLAVATADGIVSLWDVASQQIVAKTAEPTAYITRIVFRPGTADVAAEFVTIGNQSTITLWRVDGQKLGELVGHAEGAWLRSASFTADGNILATAATDNQILLWNMATNTVARTISTRSADVYAVQFSLDANKLIAINLGGDVLAWDAPAR